MQVAVKDQRNTYKSDLPHQMSLLCKEHVGKSTLKADKQVTCYEENGSLICSKQPQTIESLLPDEEDLFSGVLDELGCTGADDVDDGDFDLFSSSGGLELEGNSKSYICQSNSATTEELNCDQSGSDYAVSCENPSRTLLVKNVDNKVEDSELRFLFEQHGDIQTFYTTCRYQGFVIISYYDIRAATMAFSTLQNKLLENAKLSIHFLNPEGKVNLGHGLVQGQLRSSQIPNGNSLPQGVVENSCLKNEYIMGVHSPSEMTINAFPSDAPPQANFCYTSSIPYAVGMPSIYSQSGNRPHYSVDQAKLHNHSPSFHPQSVPISCKGFVDNGLLTFDSLNLATVGFTAETKDKHLQYGLPLHHMFGGSSRVGPRHHAFNRSNSFQNHHHHRHHLNPVIWSNSPPFDNGLPAHSSSSLPASHKSPEKNARTTSPFSFSRPRARARRIFHGKHETVSCHTDEKKYELDIERVLRGEDCRTTLMIKNIPNKYSSATLLAAINEHNQGTYDFIYLPLDFKNKCNMGYAFINMIDPLQIVRFHKSFHGKKWEKFHSGKVAYLAYARIQGKAALIAHFQESSLMNEDKCCHPILFTTDGPNAGNQEPFPLGANIPSRRNKNRCNTAELNENQEFLSTSLEGVSSYHIKNI